MPTMTDQKDHLIRPPRELIHKWTGESLATQDLCNRSSQWGYDQRGEVNEAELQQARDQELAACNNWLVLNGYGEVASRLHAALRPMTEQKSTSMMINCYWDGPPPSPHASVSDWFEQEGSKGVLYGLRISPLPSRGGNRSPKPPSLHEQGMRILTENGTTLDGRMELDPEDIETFHAVLARLKQLEDSDD